MKKSLQNQRVTLVDPYYADKPQSLNYMAYATCAMVAISIVMVVAIKACVVTPEPVAVMKDCSGCHNKMASYFKSKGSRNPERMAYAVLRTRSPRLLAAIAVFESNGNPNTRRSGYKGRHDGAFQVNEKFHGKVSKDAVDQALQAEAILQELVDHKPIVESLNHYGGESNLKHGKYAYNVLAELQRVPK